MLFDHNINIKRYVYSNDFDNNYIYYKKCFEKDMNNANNEISEITKTEMIKHINNNNKSINCC